ncbi:MAG: fasciclin domain-containing protein [Chitinophagales bacterium]
MKMNSFTRRLVFASAFLCAVIFLSRCNKTNNSGNSTTGYTITDIMKQSINATIFNKALTTTGLDTLLAGQGPFTAFIPTDSAFAASGITLSTISSVPASVIKGLVLYDIIAGSALLRASLPAGPAARMVMANGDSTFITNNSAGLFINGIPIREADIKASNGIIHAISQSALLPAQGSLYQLLQLDTSFTLLIAAVARASQGSTDVQTLLSSKGPFTLLAPVNSAFRNNGYADIPAINSANPDTLANQLLYHMLPGRLFTPDIVDGKKLFTASDSTMVFNAVSGHWKLRGNGNTSDINLINANILGYNGVLFVIDQMLQY